MGIAPVAGILSNIFKRLPFAERAEALNFHFFIVDKYPFQRLLTNCTFYCKVVCTMETKSGSQSAWPRLGFRNSHMASLLLVGALSLVLLIPVSMIRGLIAERQERRDGAVKEVTSKWGGSQILTGPALVLPYTANPSDKTRRNVVFLSKTLKTTGVITRESRGRGIFEVPVYSLSLTIEG